MKMSLIYGKPVLFNHDSDFRQSLCFLNENEFYFRQTVPSIPSNEH